MHPKVAPKILYFVTTVVSSLSRKVLLTYSLAHIFEKYPQN